jgi:hypothetical protein
MPKLWLVKIHDDDWDYDRFESAVVWADSAEEAERIVRAAPRYEGDEALWIANPDWRVIVTPAPTEGIALVHWHAG